jgi:RNA polymerase sigma-70 factor (sigma-E family)
VDGSEALVTFEQYLAMHRLRLARFAAVLAGDRDLAQDILQAVLTRAYEQWELVSAAADPHAYVRRMLVNEHLSWHRKWGRVTPSAELADLLPDQPDHADAHAVTAALLDLVQRLPRQQRAVIVLRYYEDLDDEEIADVLGCGASTVRSNIARALASLRVTSTTDLRMEPR